MTATNLTDKEEGSLLKHVADGLWNVQNFISEELNDLSATATHAVISFPTGIHILGSRIELLAPNTSTFAIILTDGTTALTTTVDASATYERQKLDQAYAADTRLSIYSDAVVGLTAATARFIFTYAIDERKNI